MSIRFQKRRFKRRYMASEKEFTPVLPQAMSYITCKVINTMETDTHTIFLGQVTDAGNLSKDTPMTYSYYHKVVKGSTPKNAPTYKGD